MSTRFQKGMTMAEVIAAVAIWVVVMVAVSAFQVNVFRYKTSISDSFTTTQNAQTLIKSVAKEIRMISPGSDGSYAIAQAATNTLTFFADVTGDGIKERIRYSVVGSILYRAYVAASGSPYTYNSASESTTTVIVNVGNGTSTPLFEYYDGNYSGTQAALTQPVTANTIRLVKINLVLNKGTGTAQTKQTYSTQVNLRNLRDNL